MAAGLDAKVTAEGVDDSAIIDFLRLAGVTEFQGYYFFRPLAADEVARLLRQPDDRVTAA